MDRAQNVFTLKMRNPGLPQPLVDSAARLIGRLMGFPHFNALYRALPPRDPAEFSRVLSEAMGVRLDVAGADFASLPANGSLVVVANHPLGLIEVATLEAALIARRPDVRTMLSQHLAAIPEFGRRAIFVDPQRRRRHRALSRAGWREAFRWLQAGHVMLVFPAGRVARFRWGALRVTEQEWSPHIAGIARRLAAPVLPIHVEGPSSVGLRLIGAMAPAVQDYFVIREAAILPGRTLRATVGRVVEPEKLQGFESDEAATDFLRAEVASLSAIGRRA